MVAPSTAPDGHENLQEASNLFIQLAVAKQSPSDESITAITKRISTFTRLSDACPTKTHTEIAVAAVQVYLESSGLLKPNVLRDYLTQLVKYVQTCHDSGNTSVVPSVSAEIETILEERRDLEKAKAALQLQAAVLQKTPQSLCSTDSPQSSDIQAAERRLTVLLQYIEYEITAHVAAKTILALVQAFGQLQMASDTASSMKGQAMWIEPVFKAARTSRKSCLSLQHHLFPGLFAYNRQDFVAFLDRCGLTRLSDSRLAVDKEETESDLISTVDVCLAALEAGKGAGLVIIDSHEGSEKDSKTVSVPSKAIYRLLGDDAASVRLYALSLLAVPHSATKMMTSNDIKALKVNLPHFFLETDAEARDDLLGCLTRFIDRLRAVTYNLSQRASKIRSALRESNAGDEAKRLKAQIVQHEDFLRWLVHFAIRSLRPSAPYQRHFISLKFLLILLRSGVDSTISKQVWTKTACGSVTWPISITIGCADLTDLLLDLMLNPFDDIRNLAGTILGITLQSSNDANFELKEIRLFGDIIVHTNQHNHRIVDMLQEAEKLMVSSGRADHADGFGRILALACKVLRVSPSHRLEDEGRSSNDDLLPLVLDELFGQLDLALDSAKNNRTEAVLTNPLHGRLTALRYLIEVPEFFTRYRFEHPTRSRHGIELYFRRVWDCVAEILCNDAPEGYVPDDMEATADADTKTILSYCWRALKEASLLARAFIVSAPTDLVERTETHLLAKDGAAPPSVLADLSSLLFLELVELRHRGAFSAVAQAFAACCTRIQKEGHQDLLERLYEDALVNLGIKGSSITRRSAGLPSLFVGILGANPTSVLFEKAMKDLDQAATLAIPEGVMLGDSLPQVHALNSLKAIFVNAKLGSASEQYIPMGLKLAGTCFKSPAWPIRNCGIMLFRALVDRLLGTSDSQHILHNSKFRWSDFPALLNVVEQLIAESIQSSNSAADSASLEGVFPVLQLLQRVPLPQTHQENLGKLLLSLMGSPHWHVRDTAARTYALTASTTSDLASSIPPCPSQGANAEHGRLLCIKHLVNRHQAGALGPCWSIMAAEYLEWLSGTPTPLVEAAYLDCLNAISAGLIRNKEGHSCQESTRIALLPSSSAILNRSMALHCIILDILHELRQSSGTTANGMQPNGEYGADDRDEHSLSDLLSVMNVWDLASLLDDLTDHIPISYQVWQTSQRLRDFIQYLARLPADTLLTSKVQLLQSQIPTLMQEQTSFSDALLGEMSSPAIVRGALLTCSFSSETAIRNLHRICAFLREDQPFDLRFAAVKALQHYLQEVSDASAGTEAPFITAAVHVHEALNDDDEEIREQASSVVQLILSQGTQLNRTLVPSLSDQRLMSFLAANHQESSYLAELSIFRLTGSAFITKSQLSPTATERVQEASNVDTALFRVEKQNLYIDHASTTSLWAGILKSLKQGAITEVVAGALATWVCEGLQALTAAADDKERFRPSDSDLFSLGVQLFSAAEVVLRWRTQSKVVPATFSTMIALLYKLQDGDRRPRLHPLWREMLDKVLTDVLNVRFGKLTTELRKVEIAATGV